MKAYEYDLAVSAVRYDALLVAELVAHLQPSLETPVVWAGQQDLPLPTAASSVLAADARVVLVVLHPLWSHEPATAADSGMLRQRMRRRPKSVVVLTLEGAVVPDWLVEARCHDLPSQGLEPAVNTLVDAIAAFGGAVVPNPEIDPSLVAARRMWGDSPPFLEQARAQNALRRELDKLSEAIESRVDVESARDGEPLVEFSVLPNRYIARQGTIAISFSWLGGRLGGISDGRLLVIQWEGVSPSKRGFAALRDASCTRETSYLVEASDDRTWHWRDGNAHGRACSTADLVGEWFDGATLVAPA